MTVNITIQILGSHFFIKIITMNVPTAPKSFISDKKKCLIGIKIGVRCGVEKNRVYSH